MTPETREQALRAKLEQLDALEAQVREREAALKAKESARKQVLLCVVNRFEAMRLRRIIFEADPHAFVVANKAHEVLGEGFNERQ